jgi:hypothetical protein
MCWVVRLTVRKAAPDIGGIRYAVNRSYVLLARPPIEPITERIPDQSPLGKAQRFGGRAYESPALPLSYSAVVCKSTERG